MAWGIRSAGDQRVRDALLKMASVDVSTGKVNERTYLAALYVEQVRTNELLEQLVTERSAVAQ